MTNINEETWKVLVLTLKNIAEDKGITQETISERTGFTQSNISRIFSLRYCPTLQTFLAIATAIEINFFFEDRDGKTELNVMLEKYLICRYGALDSTADFNTSKENFTPEYHNCGMRQNCPYEFTLCGRVSIDGVLLTKKEVQIVRLIASGNTDIQTADIAKIAMDTLLTHKKHIYTKLGIHSQAQLTAIAFRNNLIQ